MTLPIPTYDWTVLPGQVVAALGSAAATHQRLNREFLNDLLAISGVTMDHSCDSVTAGTPGDGVNRLTADANFVGAAPAVAHSWYVLHLQGILGYLLLDFDNATGTNFGSVYHSDVGYTGGTTTARPTAADERELGNNTQVFDTGNLTYTYSVSHCVEGIRAEFYNNGAAGGPGTRFNVEVPLNTPAAWTIPVIAEWFVAAGGGAGQQSSVSPKARIAGTNRSLSRVGVVPLAGNDLDGKRHAAPWGLSHAATGYLGFVVDWYWGDNSVADLECYADSQSTRAWMRRDMMIWPGDRVTAGASDQQAILQTEYESAVAETAIVDMDPAPGSLGADFEAARNVPIVITFQVPAGFLPHATVLMDGHSIWHTAYNGTSFSPLFDEHSSVQVAAGEAVMTLLPLGGWWGSPDIQVGIFMEAV